MNTLLPLLLSVAIAQPEPQAETATADPASRREQFSSEYLTDARELQFQFPAAGSDPFELLETPVMKWDTDDDWSGDVYVWLRDDRPQVVGCVLSGPTDEPRRNVYTEAHLLAEEPIAAAELHPTHTWKPATGLQRLPLGDAPEPAKSRAARLVQMRALARSFSGRMEAYGLWDLRLLPQPLYRYDESAGNVVDGALFTYVWERSTDPELILLLECRRGPAGDLTWQYAPVRFSTRELWLSRAEEELWHVDRHAEPRQGTNELVYTTDWARSLLLDEPADADE
ncbi:MAG: hypothetical protein KDA75_01625 [Planctomycetaceae bacterium]|nr:hypothetical protein [Planctomycetaceae bacterium]